MSESTEKIITRQQPGIQGCLVVLTHAKGRALHVKMCVSHKNSPHPPFTPPLPLLLHKISVHKQKDSWSTLFNPLTHCSDCTGTQSNASGATVGSVERWYHRVGQTLFCVNCAFLYLQRNYVETNEAEHWLSLFFFFFHIHARDHLNDTGIRCDSCETSHGCTHVMGNLFFEWPGQKSGCILSGRDVLFFFFFFFCYVDVVHRTVNWDGAPFVTQALGALHSETPNIHKAIPNIFPFHFEGLRETKVDTVLPRNSCVILPVFKACPL